MQQRFVCITNETIIFCNNNKSSSHTTNVHQLLQTSFTDMHSEKKNSVEFCSSVVKHNTYVFVFFFLIVIYNVLDYLVSHTKSPNSLKINQQKKCWLHLI